MGFESLDIRQSYKTNQNDVVHEFYLPVLKCATLYKRAVGFFSSMALIELSKGISGLVQNRGKIRLIVSPLLSPEDISAIQRGYDERKIVEASLEREFKEPRNNSEKERLNWLAELVATKRLEIKVAFTPPQNRTGIYHEKIGVMVDTEGNRIAFTGSMNETINAFYNNFESFMVFRSYIAEDAARVEDLDDSFDRLWTGAEPHISILAFPEALEKKLLSYRQEKLDLDLDEIEFQPDATVPPPPIGVATIPAGVTLHDYQLEAIDNWAKQGYRGIFDMATGTGKTFTGLGAAARLVADKGKAAIIIVCPYQHLVEQWVEDIERFNMHPTIGYSASKQTNWKRRLQDDIYDFSLGVTNCICFVTTNATFSSDFVQAQLKGLGSSTLLMVDEAHNFGAYNLSQTLDDRYEYRLALSATLERHGDEEGTRALYDFFGQKCIEYGLERAIAEGKLTPYYYYPKVVYLTSGEHEKYRELSKKIAKQCYKNSRGKTEVSDLGKKLLIERARLVAGAINKVSLLKSLLDVYKHDDHMLIYCGAAREYDPTKDQSEVDDQGERQIVAVSKMLGLELGMKVTHFTSSESSAERERIKRQFAEADPYQAIVAIKCLDEGVNIPSIRTAFILASSTNPKEYIQRRGRVLRIAPNKPYATIFDFVTLPVPMDCVTAGSESSRMDISLVRKEIARMKEFGEISMNPSEADQLIKELSEIYGLDQYMQGDEWDE